MDQEKLIEAIEKMSVMELSELVKALEEKFGVSAAAPVAIAAVGGVAAAAAEDAEEQTEFNVILKDVGPNKIQVIKAVRELTSLGLKEAKEVVDGAPSEIRTAVSKEEADAAKAKLEEHGAVIELK